jgi:hypothetical protein
MFAEAISIEFKLDNTAASKVQKIMILIDGELILQNSTSFGKARSGFKILSPKISNAKIPGNMARKGMINLSVAANNTPFCASDKVLPDNKYWVINWLNPK